MFPLLLFLCHYEAVAQGRAWAFLQVNPSSDNDRHGEGPDEGPLHLHTELDPQEQLNPNVHGFLQSPQTPACLLSEIEHHPPISTRDQVTQLQSHQGHRLHQQDCSSNLPCQQQTHLECVFCGSDLVDWLMERGLSTGRADARLYGVRLQLGGVLDHLTGQHSFQDESTMLYYFTHGRSVEWWWRCCSCALLSLHLYRWFYMFVQSRSLNCSGQNFILIFCTFFSFKHWTWLYSTLIICTD